MSALQSLALMVHRMDDLYELVVHPISAAPTGMVLGAGSVLSDQDYDDLVSALTHSRRQTAALLPENILGFDDRNLFWWQPACQALIGLKEGQKKVHLPALVYHLGPKGIRVTAIKNDQRPSEKTCLYHSGFPNVSLQGHWCSGGNRFPDQPRWQNYQQYQAVFLESPFTHDGGSNLRNVDDSYQFWSDKKREKPFPNARLLSMRQTLGQWLEAVK